MADVVVRITHDPLEPRALADAVRDPGRGAVVLFEGIVRDEDDGRGVTALEYEAHPDAERALARVAQEVADASGEVRIAIAHRLGALRVGDVALVAVVAAAHRAPAFAACGLLVDRVKAEVPIWKRQSFVDGAAEWVGIADADGPASGADGDGPAS